jgi:hypothetical protein
LHETSLSAKFNLIGTSGRAFSRKAIFRDIVRSSNEAANFDAVRLPVAAVHAGPPAPKVSYPPSTLH